MIAAMVRSATPPEPLFPKACGCGRTYADHDEWTGLPLRGTTWMAGERLEWRNCPCRSTLVVTVAVAIVEDSDDGEVLS